MKKTLPILILIFCVSTGMVSTFRESSKQEYDTNAKMKAVFVYNFTRYIEWPESYRQGNFIIGLLGQTAISEELDKMTQTKKAVNQTIEIKRFNSINDISQCHMLYVSKEKSASFTDALKKTKGSSTLVITEQDGFAKQGAGISFVVLNNRQKFEINKSNIQQRDMIVGSALLSLAIVVD